MRILPVSLEAGKIIDAAIGFSEIIAWAVDNGGGLKPVPERFEAVFSQRSRLLK